MPRLKLNIVSTIIALLPRIGITINTDAQSVWRQNSFNVFKKGTFLDAGRNCYVSAKGGIQIITRWDFNNDGNLDFILPADQRQLGTIMDNYTQNEGLHPGLSFKNAPCFYCT